MYDCGDEEEDSRRVEFEDGKTPLLLRWLLVFNLIISFSFYV
jgi:hypothetical protein